MKLSKDTNNAMVFGVCAGLSNYTGIDTSLIRIGFIIGTILTGSALFWIYVLLGIVLPKN